MANRIHIEVQNKNGERIDYFRSVSKPSVFPSFVLVFDDGWNDYYTYYTLFYLYFFDKEEIIHPIGEVKLMSCGDSNTKEVLQESFDKPLDRNFCSLGQSPEYYQSLHNLFSDTPDILSKLMVHLRDCAYSPEIREQFNADETFKASLIRDLNAEKALQLGKYIINGINPEQAYSFTYDFRPSYANNASTSFRVSNSYYAPGFARTKGIIGENGKGKTQLLKSLVSDIVSKDVTRFDKLPLFGSCLAICSTPFDCFQIDSPKLPFISYSLEQNNKTIEEILDALKTIIKRPMVKKKSMIEVYRDFLKDLFVPQIVNSLFLKEENDGQYSFTINCEYIVPLIQKLSSGQLHELFLITSICANIHLSSLVVIDEPEVHLHPRYIVRFMSILGSVLQEFESYAIIATHSPLIIREIPRESVYVVSDANEEDSENRIPLIGTANFNTFGEDVSKLYFEIFNYDEKESVFYEEAEKKVKELICAGPIRDKTNIYDESIRFFEKYQELSTTSRMTIRDIINKYWDQSI